MNHKAIELFAEGFINLANTVATLMIFGQIIVKKKINLLAIFAGVSFAALMYLLAFHHNDEGVRNS
jgi:hypothetical protein